MTKSDLSVAVFVLGVRDRFRGQSLLNALKHTTWKLERIDGWDSKTMPVPLEWRNDARSKRIFNRKLQDGEIACSAGHLAMLRKADEVDADISIFFEDDTEITDLKEFEAWLSKIKIKKPILWVCSHSNVALLGNEHNESKTRREKLSFIPVGTYAYILNKKAVKELLKGYALYGFQGYLADYPLFYPKYVTFRKCPIEFVKTELQSRRSIIGERGHETKQKWSRLRFIVAKWFFLNWFFGGFKDGTLRGYWMFHQGRFLEFAKLEFKKRQLSRCRTKKD